MIPDSSGGLPYYLDVVVLLFLVLRDAEFFLAFDVFLTVSLLSWRSALDPDPPLASMRA